METFKRKIWYNWRIVFFALVAVGVSDVYDRTSTPVEAIEWILNSAVLTSLLCLFIHFDTWRAGGPIPRKLGGHGGFSILVPCEIHSMCHGASAGGGGGHATVSFKPIKVHPRNCGCHECGGLGPTLQDAPTVPPPKKV